MALIWRQPEAELVDVEVHIEMMDALSAQTFQYLKKYLGYEDARRLFNAGQKIIDLQQRQLYYANVVFELEAHLHDNKIDIPGLRDFGRYVRQPVGIIEFIESPDYLDKIDDVYPALKEELAQMNSGQYVEIVLTGGIGSGKTTAALIINAYQLYLLSCLRDPHKEFSLDPSSEILFIFQSINATLAKTVDFARFKSMIESSPYFQKYFPFKKDVESRLLFPNRIGVVPVSGAETAAIGQNVIGGLIDELNYMAVTEKSKQSTDSGTYDQAITLYNSIARRRKSRFLSNGKLPGILCLVSSKKYPGQFTDIKQEEAKTDPTIYVYDKRVWEIKPEGTFTKGWFYVFVGDLGRKPRILLENEEVADQDRELILRVPEEFRTDFETDIINALREIGGVSTLASHPYFLETEKVRNAFGRHPSIFESTWCDFVTRKLIIKKNAFWKPELPRFVHVDLAITGDSAGVAIGCVYDFINMKKLGRGNEEGMMPMIRFDGILEIRPPRNAEILFFKIREVIVALRKMGMNIRWVTFDSFESTDSQQLLRQQAFITGEQSMDIVPCKPYDFLKSAVYDGRVAAPEHVHTQTEILQLERDTKTGKIDHPPNGSKDCADSMAGVAYGLTMRREIWGQFGIPLVLVPSSVVTTNDKLTEKDAKAKANIAEQELDPNNPNDLRMRRGNDHNSNPAART